MNIHEALGAVTELRRRVLARQRFRGYSGLARAAGGTVALVAAAIAKMFSFEANNNALLVTWGAVFCAAFVLNYGAVLWWRVRARAESDALAPALEPLPILLAGGAITAALLRAGNPELLPGAWMCIFALTNFTAKYALPRRIRLVGWFYMAAGIGSLLVGAIAWREPAIMGGVFFAGEWAGGLILHGESAAKFARRDPGTFPLFNDNEN